MIIKEYLTSLTDKLKTPELKPGEKPKWYDVRFWTIGEYGSAASIIGVGLWIVDQKKTKKKGKK